MCEGKNELGQKGKTTPAHSRVISVLWCMYLESWWRWCRESCCFHKGTARHSRAWLPRLARSVGGGAVAQRGLGTDGFHPAPQTSLRSSSATVVGRSHRPRLCRRRTTSCRPRSDAAANHTAAQDTNLQLRWVGEEEREEEELRIECVDGQTEGDV